jgi:hypothetical protein
MMFHEIRSNHFIYFIPLLFCCLGGLDITRGKGDGRESRDGKGKGKGKGHKGGDESMGLGRDAFASLGFEDIIRVWGIPIFHNPVSPDLQVLIRHPLPTQYVLQMDISQEKMMNRWILGNVNPWMSKPWLFLFRGCSHSQVASGAQRP